MNIGYIEKYNSNEFQKIFKIIKKDIYNGKNLRVEIPKTDDNVANKLIKILSKNNISNIVCSEEILKNKRFINELYSKNINILNGRVLYKFLTIDIVEYVLKKINLEKEKLNLSILINDTSELNLKIIESLSEKIKRVNIVTNHIDKFQKIQDKLYEKNGIMINVTNNKRKALVKSEIIINIDFKEEIINKYNIYSKAIIINIEENIKIKLKKYQGINICYYNINVKDNNILDEFKGFNINEIYESFIFRRDSIENTLKKIKNDNIIISELIGNNGIINESEYKNLNKDLTKQGY